MLTNSTTIVILNKDLIFQVDLLIMDDTINSNEIMCWCDDCCFTSTVMTRMVDTMKSFPFVCVII